MAATMVDRMVAYLAESKAALMVGSMAESLVAQKAALRADLRVAWTAEKLEPHLVEPRVEM